MSEEKKTPQQENLDKLAAMAKPGAATEQDMLLAGLAVLTDFCASIHSIASSLSDIAWQIDNLNSIQRNRG